MNFKIEEVIELESDKVEVRARLEDGRLAVVTVPSIDTATQEAAVAAYLAEHQGESNG